MHAVFHQEEADRIKRVYAYYDKTAYEQAKRDTLNLANRAMAKERQKKIYHFLHSSGWIPLAKHKILEIGCGGGGFLASLINWGAKEEHLYGIDLLADRIETARQKYPNIHFYCGNAEELAFSSGEFNIVVISTVFSSILDNGMAHNIAQEVRRVLKPGGGIIWYDMRYYNPFNPHTYGIRKQRINSLFPGFTSNLCSITLLPPLARCLGKLTPVLYPILSAIPFLRTHYLGLLVKPN